MEPFDRFLRGVEAISASSDLPVGITPKDEVWSLNKTVLYRYRPTRPEAERHKTPLLLVYSLVNRPYIFDLRPGRSFVEYLLERGFDVFLLDWGSPGPEDRGVGIDDYVADYLPRAVRALRRAAKSDELHLIGYCLGAVQAVMYAALNPEVRLATLTLLTAPLDFAVAEKSAFARWLGDATIDARRLVDASGNVPAEVVELGAKMLKPVENFVGTYAGLFDKLDDPKAVEGWQALNRWVHDGVPFAGEAFRQWTEDFVRENKLIAGRLSVRGRPVDLGQIRCPVLNVIAEHDHIVPPAQSLSVLDKIGSERKRLERIPAGHVGLMIGRSARYDLWPKIADFLLGEGPGVSR
jgi:polyhydroxyalkanoate synthase